MLIKFAFVNLIIDWQAELFRTKLSNYFEPDIVEELFPGRTHLHYDYTDSINNEELQQSGLYQEYKINKNEKVKYYGKGKIKSDVQNGKNINKDIKRKLFKSLYEILNPAPGFSKGSNTWVIHGNHTKSGKPILCGDPHLDNNVPSIWYIAEIKYFENDKKRFIMGATMTGIPFIIFGRSQYLAWSGAIAIGDNSDAFEEVLNEDETKYYFNGEYHDLIIKTEQIKVKGRDPETLIIKKTRHGPLLKYFLSEISVKELWLDRDISFAWPGFMDEENSLSSFYNLYKIDDWQPEKIIQSFANLSFTSISINLATNDGHILAVITSSWLKKLKQSPLDDYFPKDGTDPSNEWLGLIDPMEKPYVIDPEKGYLFQANNKFAGDGYKYQTASNYIATARGSRINELLSEMIKKGQKITIEDMMKMQQDTVDIYARDMVGKMIGITQVLQNKFTKNEINGLQFFMNKLKGWTAEHNTDSIQATIFNVWQYLFRSHLLMFFENEEDSIAIQHVYQFEQFLMHQITKWNNDIQNICFFFYKIIYHKIVNNKAEPTYDICPQVHYSRIKNQQHLELVQQHCAYLLPITLLMVKDYLIEQLGNNIDDWKWGNLHFNRYLHIPFSQVPLLRELYERRKPGFGNINTINCGVQNFKAKNFESYHGPNFRMISEMDGDLYQIIDTGQNENIFSENYFDQAELFQKGKYIKMDFGNFEKKK